MIKVFLISFCIIFSSYASDKPISTTLECTANSCNLQIQIAKDWKIYAHDQGVETSLDIKLLEPAVENFEVLWDKEETFQEEFFGIQAKYHKNNSLIPITFQSKNESFSLPLEINYAACKDTCLFLSEKIIYQSANNNLLWLLGSAILGGFLLNFMPCLFPVLGLKILSLQKTKNNLISFYLGIIASFVGFAVLNILLKGLGKNLGWGFHFQEPLFLAFIALILGLSSLSLMGILTIPNRFQLKDPKSDFLKGIFLVLIATSCTGPFLGSALAFSLTQGPLTILLIYLTIGFGFGLPYLVLIIKPELLKLPKAGTWLNKLQFFLSIPLALSSLWFLSLLIRDAVPLFIATVCLIFLPLIVKSLKWLVIPLIISLGLFSIKSSEVTLEKIDLKEVKDSINNGRQVLITITSDWCVTCKVNEKLILNNQEIRKKLDQEGVLIIKGDYTRGSSDLTDYIKSHKRSGVPLNVVYGPKAPQGIVLPVLFSEKELFTALEESKNSKQ